MKSYKIVIIVIILLSLINIKTNAQGFYIDAGLGYGFKASSQVLGTNFTSSNSGSTYSSDSVSVKGSFGAGMNYGLAFGYMISEHIGVELGISYLNGATIQSTTSTNDVGNFATASTTNLSGTMLRLIPTLKICGKPNTLTPYIKAGLVIGLSPSITSDYKETDTYTSYFPTPTTTDTALEMINKYSGGLSLGFSLAVGLDVKLSNMISVYGEVGMVSQTWAPTSGTLSTDTKDGVDLLPDLTASQKQITFVDNYTLSSANPVNTSKATEQLKTYYPFSSWGFNIGMHFNFGGGSK